MHNGESKGDWSKDSGIPSPCQPSQEIFLIDPMGPISGIPLPGASWEALLKEVKMEGEGTCFRANPQMSLLLTRWVTCHIWQYILHPPYTILEQNAFKLLALFFKLSLPKPSCFCTVRLSGVCGSGFVGRTPHSAETAFALYSRPRLPAKKQRDRRSPDWGWRAG